MLIVPEFKSLAPFLPYIAAESFPRFIIPLFSPSTVYGGTNPPVYCPLTKRATTPVPAELTFDAESNKTAELIPLISVLPAPKLWVPV